MLRRLIPSARFLLLSSLAAIGCAGEPSPDDGGDPAEAERAEPASPPAKAASSADRARRIGAELTLPEVESGELWSLEALLDPSGETCPRAFLVAFLSSGCAPCVQALPLLEQAEEEYPDLAVILVAVDGAPAARQAMLAAARQAGIGGPVLAADEAAMLTWVGERSSVPRYYFLNSKGAVINKAQGQTPDLDKRMLQYAAQALSK